MLKRQIFPGTKQGVTNGCHIFVRKRTLAYGPMAAAVYGEVTAARNQALALYRWQPQVWHGEIRPPTKHPLK
jgi:hypothetical protein